MTFINQYIKKQDSRYIYSEQFNEGGTSVIFAIGETEESGLISKLDSSGNVIWEKLYTIDQKEKDVFTVSRIIQISNTGKNGEEITYIACLGSGKGIHYLMSVSPEKGEVMWAYAISPKIDDSCLFLRPATGEYAFYLAVSGGVNSSDSYIPTLTKFDGNGKVMFTQGLAANKKPFMIASVSVDNGRILVTGNQGKNYPPLNFVMELDADLKLVNSFSLEAQQYQLYDAVISDKNCIVTGRNISTGRIFVCKVTGTDKPAYSYIIPDSNDQVSSLCLLENGFYLHQYGSGRGITHRFDPDFTCRWSKEMRFSQHSNEIEEIRQCNGSLTFNGHDKQLGYFIAHTDAHLNTAKTKALNTIELLKEICAPKNAGIQMEGGDLSVSTAKILSSDITSETVPVVSGNSTFVNRYIPDNRIVYREAIQVAFAAAPRTLASSAATTSGAMFGIGSYDGKGLISKFALDGTPVWSRTYNTGKDDLPLNMEQIIRISDNKSGESSYIVYATGEDNRHFLMSLSTDKEDVLWAKEFFPDMLNGTFILKESKKEYGFFLAVSENRNVASVTVPSYIGRFDNKGNLIYTQRLFCEGKPFCLTSMAVTENEIAAIGEIPGEKKGMVMNLEYDLKVKEIRMLSGSEVELYDIQYYGEKEYLVTGKNKDTESLFVFRYCPGQKSVTLYTIPESGSDISSLCTWNHDFYLTRYGKNRGTVSRFNKDFTCLWTKRIEIIGSYGNGIKNVRQSEGRLTFTGYDESVGSFIGNTGTEFNTERTKTGEPVKFFREEVAFQENDAKQEKYDIPMKDIDLVSEEIEKPEVDTLHSPVNDFINVYPKKESSIYTYANRFEEKGRSYTLAVGNVGEKALISKINYDGSVSWEQSYELDKEKIPLTVRKIVQISGKEGLDYIAYVSTDKNRHFLLSVRSEDGELNWMEEIYLKVEVPVVYLETLPDMKTIYLVIADKNGKTNPVIHKFNFEGRMTDSGEIRYQKRNFTVRAVDIYGDRIALACNFTDSSSAFILDLNSRLNPVKNEMILGMDCELYDIKFYKGYNYLVTGKNHKSDRLFIMQVGPGTAFSTRYEMANANAESATLSVRGNGFYLVREEKKNGSVYYFNQDFHNLWAKQIVLSGNNQNGISRITNLGNTVTFTGLDEQNGYFVAGINRDLDSTQTVLLPSADLLAERVGINRGEAIVESARTPETGFLPASRLEVTAEPVAILNHRLTFLVSSIFTGHLEFVYSEQFEEILPSQGVDTPVFMVGKHNDRGLIIKTGPDGRIMWQHLYVVQSQTSPLMIHKIIQVSGNAGTYQYVVRMSSQDNRHYLMCVSSLNGSMVWIKEFGIDPFQDTFFLERAQGENAFYLVCTGPRYKTFINKFSSAGNLLLTKSLTVNSNAVQIKAVNPYSQGLLLACVNYDVTVDNCIVDLDSNLRTKYALSMVDPYKWDFYDVKYYQGRYLVLGRNLNTQLLFIASLLWNDGLYTYYEIPATVSSKGNLCVLEDDFYLTQYSDENGIVHRFRNNFQGVWSKEIVMSESHRNRIMFLKQLNRRLTFTGYDDTAGSFMGNTNENLSSCRTEVLDLPRLLSNRCYVKRMYPVIYEAELNLSTPVIRYSAIMVRTANLCADYGPGTTHLSDKFALQTAGSQETTDGSAKGIHVRWAFRGILGDKHLPKGDYALTRHNFNKENDYVKLYRTAYERVPYNLNFAAGPNGVEDAAATWIYGRYNIEFCVYFLDQERYNTVRETIDPLARPMEFIEAYGDNPIEVESRRGLFFAVSLNVSNYSNASSLKTETLSVEKDLITTPRYTNSRKTYTGSSVSNVHIMVENGKSVRFAASYCRVTGITFEFYSNFLAHINDDFGWDDLGKYALSLDDNEVLRRLEPEDGLIHGKWPRYNDNAYVNVDNYRDKWHGPLNGENDRNIKTVVSKFIELSNEIDNPRANESVFLGPDGESLQSPDDMMDLSLLDFLNVGANDFHVARMLGLGAIDHDERVFDGKYVYVAQYFTHVDLEDGEGERTMEHLAMSLPTSIYDERLPLPVTLERIAPGIVNAPNNQGTPSNVTDADGYTRDGRYRYVTLIAEPEIEDEINQPFYASSREFNYSEFTMPIYGGVEYRKENDNEWVKPELSNDPSYQNIVLSGQSSHNETIPLLVSEDTGVLYIHKQRNGGLQFYSSYGINIFSRATSSPVTLSILTDLQPANTLKPPVNIKAHLIREERPLLLTSQLDQNRYAQLSTAADKTLIRLTFDYHTHHELTTYMVEDIYEGMTTAQLENNSSTAYPNDMEIYAEEIEIFFRNRVPRSVSGKATLIQDDFGDPLLSIIRTQPYHVASTGEDLVPAIPSDLAANYTGGVFMMGDERYIIHSVIPSNTNPTIRVYKREISDTLVMSDIPSPDADNLQAPQITDDGLFTVMENMQNTTVWGDYNPNNLKIKVGHNWTVKREIFEEFNENEQRNKRYLEKSRGFWQNAVIEPIEEPVDRDDNNNLIYGYQGLYKLVFNGFTLPQHPQYDANGISVEWYNGIVRLKRKPAYLDNGERTRFEVVKMENHASALILYIQDPVFEGVDAPNAIQRGTQSVNYYPGYKVYLYADNAAHLTEEHILPVEEEVKYSIFGLRSHDLDYPTYYSRMSEPVLMFAQKLEEPQRPELPQGSKYATRPDFFGKSTYTFTTRFTHRPTNVLFYRSNDELFLNALYKKDTLSAIRSALEPLGANDEEYLVNRWENFLDFSQLAIDGNYKIYPPAGISPDGYRFPLPDHPAFISAINDFVRWYNAEYNLHINTVNTISSLNQVIIPASSGHAVRRVVDFIEQVIFNAFVPLTELPITYQYIKPNALHPGDYNPLPKKQNIKDMNGYMLQPADPEFDVAPMAKITDSSASSPSVLFTDFTLDGTSKNIYFYSVKEMNNQMRMGDFSPVLGPIKLVNTNAPEAPAVKNVIPVLDNEETLPAIKFEINAYPENQFIRKITIYRAHNLLDAQSVRTMERVEVIDLEEAGILNDTIWTFYDDFRGMAEVPYGDSLYYRITVSRKVEYNEENTGIVTEYAPSQPSKIIATFIVDTSVPESPVLDYTADELSEENELYNVVLSWQKTVYNGTYYLYKMNNQGSWNLIKELTSNENDISLPLLETEWGTGRLSLTDENGDSLYHHFKVLVKNSSGIMSIRENILTIGNEIEDDQNPGPDPEPRNEIWNRTDLLAFMELVNGGTDERAGEIWYLMADIDLTGIPNLSIGGSDGFRGTFEGNFHRLYNITIRDSSIFSTLHVDGAIRNLLVTDADITTGMATANLSILVNFVRGLIENCYVQGTIRTGSDSLASGKGGIASMNLATGKILNCFVNVSITGRHRIGGITGNNGGIVEKCYTTGVLNCSDLINGGVVAQQGNTGIVKDCVNIIPAITGLNPGVRMGTNRVYSYEMRSENNYSLATATINGNTITGGTAANRHGQNVTDAQLKTRAFWESIGYDFVNIWKMSTITGPYRGYPIFIGMEE